MPSEAPSIDLSAYPELARIVHEAARSGRRLPLVENGTVIAVVAPAKPRRAAKRIRSKEEVQRILAETHGAWKGLIDPEEFKRQRRELQIHDREPRTW
jgi:hypothetical protein